MSDRERIRLTQYSHTSGCAAKVGPGTLAQVLGKLPKFYDPNLLVGTEASDDAAVYRISDELAMIQTVDCFTPIVDDPYTFGQIAAAIALSDVYAMGGEPKLALNIMCLAQSMDDHAVQEILRGGYDKAYEAGAIITGGHTIQGAEPIYGLAVSGFVHPKKVLTNSGAKPGDVLILTKPLGVGVLAITCSAYHAEIFRAGIESVPHGQAEAAYSLGMTWSQVMSRIVIPHAVRYVKPTMTSEFVMLYKDTSLLSSVGVMELMLFSNNLTATTGNLTPYISAALYYLVVTIPLIHIVTKVEHRLAERSKR